jgi:hypothetical protein
MKWQGSCINMAVRLLTGQLVNQGWIPSRGVGSSSQHACQLCDSHQQTNFSVPGSLFLVVKCLGHDTMHFHQVLRLRIRAAISPWSVCCHGMVLAWAQTQAYITLSYRDFCDSSYIVLWLVCWMERMNKMFGSMKIQHNCKCMTV